VGKKGEGGMGKRGNARGVSKMIRVKVISRRLIRILYDLHSIAGDPTAGVTAWVTAPGDTNPSDTTAFTNAVSIILLLVDNQMVTCRCQLIVLLFHFWEDFLKNSCRKHPILSGWCLEMTFHKRLDDKN